ncbi:MAG: VOC family protein [Neisseriaceae bacterium]|jgi:PhnB protein
MVKKIREGYNTLTPYLIVEGANDAISFYKKAFNAEERMRMPTPDGKVAHAELIIGDSVFMVADEFPDMGFKGPKSFGGAPVGLHLYVEDVDSAYNTAMGVGATSIKPPKDQFYGDRSCLILDPFGHQWSLATHIEDVSPEELQERMKQGCS